ncbi:Major facilitator superfamily like protein [Aduncisulcus paluster]|uniref:Major facilitator superfamily like protein n=1 Tax=Aduncisulcus paluster TaxID=2918883 RepID=A0ABQ5K1P8_9EUKA|nr:Major facilitator superfamily like protein [Aduncisulcus paluster]
MESVDKTIDESDLKEITIDKSSLTCESVRSIGSKSYHQISDRDLSAGVLSLLTGTIQVTLQAEAQYSNLVSPYIKSYFEIEMDMAQLVVTVFSIVNSSLLFLAGKLSDIYGPVFILNFGLRVFYVFGSFLAFISQSFPMLLIARIIQAIGVSMMSSTPTAIAGQKVKKGSLPSVLALFTVIASLGASVTPLIGSKLLELYGWSTVYLVGPYFAIFSYILCRTFLRDHNRVKEASFDWNGTIMLTLAIAMLISGLSMMSMSGVPSWLSGLIFILGICAFVGFVFIEEHTAIPMIPISIFGSRLIIFPVLCTICAYIGIYACGYLLSFIMTTGFGYTATQLGFFMMLCPLPMCLGGILGGSFNKKVVTRLACFSTLVALSVSIVIMALGIFWRLRFCIFVGMLFAYFSIGLYIVPCQNFILTCTPARYVGVASSLLKVDVPVGQGVGTALGVLIHTILLSFIWDGNDDSYTDDYMTTSGITFIIAAIFPILSGFILLSIGVVPPERGKLGFSEHAINTKLIERAARDGVPGMTLGAGLRARIGQESSDLIQSGTNNQEMTTIRKTQTNDETLLS